MCKGRSSDTPDPAAVLQSMTLLATLSTAEEVRESMAERRTGRDPSAQVPPDLAAARLHGAGDTLMDLLMQLVLGQAADRDDDENLAHAVRHFDFLMKLRRADRLVATMHQHLLSLYPEASEALMEEARHVRNELEALADPEIADAPALPDVLERGISFVVWTQHEVEV